MHMINEPISFLRQFSMLLQFSHKYDIDVCHHYIHMNGISIDFDDLPIHSISKTSTTTNKNLSIIDELTL